MGDWVNEKVINRNKNINRGYRKLEVWKEAIELFVFTRKKLKSLENVPFKIKAQIEDSILSVSSNIAEDYSRRYLKENIQFNSIALSSLAENYSQIFALFSSGDIDERWFDEYDRKHFSLENKLINYNKAQINQLKEKIDWKNDYLVKEIVETYNNIE